MSLRLSSWHWTAALGLYAPRKAYKTSGLCRYFCSATAGGLRSRFPSYFYMRLRPNTAAARTGRSVTPPVVSSLLGSTLPSPLSPLPPTSAQGSSPSAPGPIPAPPRPANSHTLPVPLAAPPNPLARSLVPPPQSPAGHPPTTPSRSRQTAPSPATASPSTSRPAPPLP